MITVTVARECGWTASSQNSWLSFTSSANGQGDGTVAFRVAQNADPVSRSGAILVEDQRVGVGQDAAPCTYRVTMPPPTADPAGATLSAQVDTPSVCQWTASTNASWIALAPPSGSGSRTLSVTVSANSGAARTGSLTIAGQSMTLSQSPQPAAPPPTPTPSPTPTPAPAPTPSPAPTPTPPQPTPNPPPAPTPPPAPQAIVSGKVESLTGKCPTLQFEVKKTTVFTTADTTFSNGSCKDVDRGTTVTVTGTIENQKLRADRIELKN
jgi:Domain of unknown function (DUF5666)/Putative binding domain, N-terminal